MVLTTSYRCHCGLGFIFYRWIWHGLICNDFESTVVTTFGYLSHFASEAYSDSTVVDFFECHCFERPRLARLPSSFCAGGGVGYKEA